MRQRALLLVLVLVLVPVPLALQGEPRVSQEEHQALLQDYHQA